jgi:signal transduction histidine kinase
LTVLAAEFHTRFSVKIHLSLAGEPDVPRATCDALVMIVREALYNVVKHACASRVEILLEKTIDGMVLIVTDNGDGFDPRTPKPGHFGLRSIRERADAVGATVELDSRKGVGTRIRIALGSKRPM